MGKEKPWDRESEGWGERNHGIERARDGERNHGIERARDGERNHGIERARDGEREIMRESSSI